MASFKIGDKVRVIIPMCVNGISSNHLAAASALVGMETFITDTYIAFTGIGGASEIWFVLGSISIYGFCPAWLELITSSSNISKIHNSICRCDINKLMARGCNCGAFQGEQGISENRE